MNSNQNDLQSRMREVELMWNQIAHERVKERLDRLLTVAAFRTGRSSQDDAHKAYSEQASKLKSSTSRIVSRELEESLYSLEDTYVQEAFETYCDETPEREITDTALLWMVYQLGLCPFIDTKVLRDICFKLDQAQPSLGLNISRPDAERFFSYQSERLKAEFPVVIRIVDRLKTAWGKKISARTAELAQAVSTKSDQLTTPMPQKADVAVSLGELDRETDVPVGPIFTHSESYESISFNGESYTLQERQAAVVRLLHEAVKKAIPRSQSEKFRVYPGVKIFLPLEISSRAVPNSGELSLSTVRKRGRGVASIAYIPLLPPDSIFFPH